MNNQKRWLYLVVGTVILSFAGLIYAWSILKGAFADAFGWSADSLATAYTITISFFCVGCVLGGIFMKKIGVKPVLLISAILAFAGFYTVSRMSGASILTLYVSYGVMSGLAIGMSYNTILALIGAWFPDKKGLSSGILMMGFGASTMVFGNLAASLMENPAFGWRKVFAVIAICLGASLLLGTILFTMPEKNKSTAKGADDDRSLPPLAMLKRVSFWKIFIAMTILGTAGSSVISFGKDFALSNGVAAATAGLLVGFLSIANGLGRILAGYLFDKLGSGFIKVFICVLEIVACVVCILTIVTGSTVLCAIGFILMGLSFGSNGCTVATMIGSYYGPKYYAQNLSFGLLTMLPSSFLVKLSATIVGKTGGYMIPFVILIVYGFVALGLNLSNKEA